MNGIGSYRYHKMPIGKGSYSLVYEGINNTTAQKVAIKKINISLANEMAQMQIKSEIDIMRRLRHNNIVRFLETLSDTDGNIYLVMEFCEGGTLAVFLNGKPMKEKFCREYIRQIAEAMKYLYGLKILHRDIKPQNILLSKDGVVKLGDFGFAKILDGMDGMTQTICGSPIYMAPEIIKCNRYSTKTDLWSIGVIIYEMIIGKPPYRANTHLELIQKIETMPVYIPLSIMVSDECWDLIKGLLQREPNKRMDWEEFFEHRWFRDNVNNSANAMAKLNLEDSIMECDYNPGRSKPIEIKRPATATNPMAIPGRGNSLVFNSPLLFTPNDKNGYVIIDIQEKDDSDGEEDAGNINNVDDEGEKREITESFADYISNTMNYFKSYYWSRK